MRKTISRVAMAAALLTLATTTASAEKAPSPTKGVEVRVINNYVAPVRVYVLDASGRTHDMGWVGRADLKILAISDEIAGLGAFEIKAFPDEPVWRLNNDQGVRTNRLTLAEDEALNFWIETNLNDSILEVVKS